MKRTLSFALVISIVLSVFTISPSKADIGNYIDSLGYITSLDRELLSYGLVYTELSAEKDNNQKAYIFDYSPNRYTVPQVEYGSDTSSKVRLKDITSRYEKEGMRVVGAMNGDFFSFSTGVPMGVVIKDGIIISSDPSKNAIGFAENGFADIGNPDIHFTFSCIPSKKLSAAEASDDSQSLDTVRQPYTFTLDYFNKYPSVYAVYLLNDKYSDTTKSTSPSTEIILKPLSGQMSVGGIMRMEVVKVNYNAVNTEIPKGHYVLCGDDRSFASTLAPIQEGDILTLEIQANSSWKNIRTALGGGDIIVQNGKFIPETVDETHEKVKNPRTAIGIRDNHDVVFFANDGRDRKNAAGVNIESLAKIMIELGCKTVINLDGGGSTTVYATTPFDTSAKLVNNPSDGSERYISNAILFLNNLPRTNETGGVKITNKHNYMLTGSSIELETIYHDTNYHPFEPQTETFFSEQSYTGRTHGEFTNNVFTATKAGFVTLSAANGNTKGLKTVTILPSPSEFITDTDRITLEAGKSVPLNIRALYNGEEVIFNNIDVIDYRITETTQDGSEASGDFSFVGYISDGAFYGDEYFRGVLELSMEDTYIKIPLEIIPEIFKNNISNKNISATYDNANLDILESDEKYLEKEYILLKATGESESPMITLQTKSEYKLDKNAKSFVFLSKNDITASLVLKDENDREILIPYVLERNYSVFNGWFRYKADLSEVFISDSEKQYTISHLVAFNTASNVEYILGDFCEITGEEALYTDIEGSWAKEHIIDVYYQGLMKGKPYYTADIFDGDALLTRAEFATILCRFLNIDLSKYAEQTPDFADINAVGSWAWNQICAVDALGIMSGSTENDGKRYFRPQDGISRAETMQVIGRLLNAPADTVELNFSDAGIIPDWAKENAAKTVTYSIFTGYSDNTIKPFNKLTRNEAAKIFSLFNTQSFYDLLNFVQTDIPSDMQDKQLSNDDLLNIGQ